MIPFKASLTPLLPILPSGLWVPPFSQQSLVLVVADPAATCPARGPGKPMYDRSLLPKSARRHWKKHWDRIQRPGSLYTEDDVLLERGLLAGGECSLLWFPIQLYCDLFMHSQAGMHYEDRIFITLPQENPSTSQSHWSTLQGSWEQGTVWMMLSMDDGLWRH